MWTRDQATEIASSLGTLPPDQPQTARELVLFLRERDGGEPPIDERETWSDEDLRGLTAAVLKHAEESL